MTNPITSELERKRGKRRIRESSCLDWQSSYVKIYLIIIQKEQYRKKYPSLLFLNMRLRDESSSSSGVQISVHSSIALDETIHDVKWIPSSARFCVLGAHARGTGSLQVFELENTHPLDEEASSLSPLSSSPAKPSSRLVMNAKGKCEHDHAMKCGTFAGSDAIEREFIAGDFSGQLLCWDVEYLTKPTRVVKNAHESIINCIDGCYNQHSKVIVTGSRDGSVKVWDFRRKESDPVVNFAPSATTKVSPECWSVNVGNAKNDSEPMILAGYSDGTVKMFDLRRVKNSGEYSTSLYWETNVDRGVCGVEFDRKAIEMNKFVVTCLESQSKVFDARTFNPKRGGFSSSVVTEVMENGPTIWGVKHSPFNREISVFLGGDGTLSVHKYAYPKQRRLQLNEEECVGNAGQTHLLVESKVSTQPISAFDWNKDKEGLAICSSFDSRIRLLFITGMNKL